MFETVPAFEFKTSFPPELFGDDPGTKKWRVVRKVLNIPSFMLSVSVRDADLIDTLLIGDIRDAISLATNDAVEDHQLYVLLPNYLADGGEPALYRLSLVFEGRIGEYPVTGYTCANGKTYLDFHGGDVSADAVIEEKTILYSK